MAKEEEIIIEMQIAKRLAEMGLVPWENSKLGKKIKIRPVRIGMPGTPEEGQVFGPPKKDTSYPIDHVRVMKDKDGQIFVSLFSSKAGNKPITYRSLNLDTGFEQIPRERALVPYERNLPAIRDRNLPVQYQRNLPATIGNADTRTERKLLPSGERKLLPPGRAIFAPGVPQGGPPGGPLYEYDKKEAASKAETTGIDPQLVKKAVDITNLMPETPFEELFQLYLKDHYVDRATKEDNYPDYYNKKIRWPKVSKGFLKQLFRDIYNRRYDPANYGGTTIGQTDPSRKRRLGYAQREEALGYSRAGWRRGMAFQAKPGVEGGEARTRALYRSALNRGRTQLRRFALDQFKIKLQEIKELTEDNRKKAKDQLKKAQDEFRKAMQEFKKEAEKLLKDRTAALGIDNIISAIGDESKGPMGGAEGLLNGFKQDMSNAGPQAWTITGYYKELVNHVEKDLEKAEQNYENLQKGELELLKNFQSDLQEALTGKADEISAGLQLEYSVNLSDDDKGEFESIVKNGLHGEAGWLASYFFNKARGRILRKLPTIGMGVRGLSMGSQTLGDVWTDIVGNLWSFLTGPWVLGGFVSFALFWMILTWSQNAPVVIAMASI